MRRLDMKVLDGLAPRAGEGGGARRAVLPARANPGRDVIPEPTTAA